MKRFFAIILILSTSLVMFAQKPETVLFKIGDDFVTVGDFQYIYEKNNKNDGNFYSEASLKEYLNLFVNFKLKVKEAKRLGIDTSEKFVNEFKTYRDQLTKPYMTDKKTTDKLVTEGYERMKQEIRASHILIRVDEDASKEEVDKAYKKIMEVYKKAAKGEDFTKLATEYSEDPSVKSNNGDLGYFSVFQLIYKFESAAYNTEVGKVSKPFRTEFGYHILKVTDKRPYLGNIKVALIFVSASSEESQVNQDKAKSDINDVYNKLLAGENFESLVKIYSDDDRTKNSNGVMPEFNTFSFNVPETIKEEAFKLKTNGEFSKPFQTPNGWYILKRIDIKPLKTYEEMESFIRAKVRKDSRSQLSYENLIISLKKKFRFKENKKNLAIFYTIVDSSLSKGTWAIKNPELLNNVLFLIGKEQYSQLDFAKFLIKNQKSTDYGSLDYAIDRFYNLFVNESLLNYNDKHLEENYPEFKNLVNEYKEGMMLFEITDQMVWSKAMKDTTGQEKFYEANIANYMWKQRVDAETYICKDEAIAKEVSEMITIKKMTADEIATALNEKNPLNISYSKGRYEQGENKLLADYFGKTGVYIIKDESANTWKVINLYKYIEPEPKKLKEIRGIVIADYQSDLEQSWLKELKAKYSVTINDKVLEELITTHKQ